MLEGHSADPGPLAAELGPARTEELQAVLELVRAAGLPTDGIAERFPDAYGVARLGLQVVGVAGLEAHGHVGLLRSLAVLPAQRGEGLGRRLIEDRWRAARELRLEAVYLLTTTAADYFRRLGYQDTPRSGAPEALHRSSEFATLCPASAACLAKACS